MGAGRVAPGADALRVKPQFGGVFAHPAQGLLQILHRRREARGRGQAVSGVDHDEAAPRQLFGDQLGVAGVAGVPGTAMHQQHRRHRPLGLRHVDVGVQNLRPAGGGVDLVADAPERQAQPLRGGPVRTAAVLGLAGADAGQRLQRRGDQAKTDHGHAQAALTRRRARR